MRIKLLLVLTWTMMFVSACSVLADMAMNAVGGSKGGINTELVVGDKEQVVGTNLEVKAKNVGKINGTSDNSISAPGAKEVQVINNTFPVWVVILIGVLTTLIGYLAPRPQAWKRLIQRKSNEELH
ncbi:MAG: hypothetical protein V3T88_03790 [Nitrosomonadaceae bacterium]